MELKELKSLLDFKKRMEYFKELLSIFRQFTQIDHITYQQYETSEGPIPCIYIKNNGNFEDLRYLKVFVASQHNEYNGLFGILKFLNQLIYNKNDLSRIISKDQDIIFLPIMNPYGFINPRKDNKSGYFLKNGTNLNRFWRRTFASEHLLSRNDSKGNPLPEHSKIVKKILQKYWNKEDIYIYILDYHETSLLDKFSIDLLNNFSEKLTTYKFDHWLKEGIILNVIKLFKIPYYKKPLFIKCDQSADHTHINLTNAQLKTVYEKLKKYIAKNSGKLPFYFCYSDISKDFCKRLSNRIYEKLKDILWETYYPAFDHHFHDHGCFVKMSDAISRKNVYTMELESQKQFFDIFDEFKKSKSDPDYFKKKLYSMNLGIELALESIKEMIKIF